MGKTVHTPSGVEDICIAECKANEKCVGEGFVPKVPGNQSRNDNVEKRAEKLVMSGMKK